MAVAIIFLSIFSAPAAILTIIFVVLRLIDQIDWAWGWVLSPLWILLATCAVLLIISSAIRACMDGARKKRMCLHKYTEMPLSILLRGLSIEFRCSKCGDAKAISANDKQALSEFRNKWSINDGSATLGIPLSDTKEGGH